MLIVPIENFNGYFIADTGQVFCNKGKGARANSKPKDLYEIAPRVARNGYTRVYMRSSVTNKRVDRYIHRLSPSCPALVRRPLSAGDTGLF